MIWVLSIGIILLAMPIATLALECFAALLPGRRNASALTAYRPRVDVLIPAHNEAAVIEATLRSVRQQMRDGDRLCVVADNCTDRTAELARHGGALVAERFNEVQRGKGYALEHGLQHLAEGHAEVVVVIDADCQLLAGALDRLAEQCAATQRPVQAIYQMWSPPNSPLRDVISQLAVLVKNHVRLRGVDRLGGPCLLMGSGMAFPWQLIRSAPIGSGNIVEDMQLTYDLLLGGAPTSLCLSAVVTAPLPNSTRAARSQRTRWEHGHLQTLIHWVPRLLLGGLKRCRPGLCFAAADLAIPPISLLIISWLALFTLTLLAGLGWGEWAPAQWAAVQGCALVASIVLVVAKFGQSGDLRVLFIALPSYILGKLPIYFKFIVSPQRAWLRTERDAAT